MSITPTGHAEIDQQHDLLNSMVAQLTGFCSENEYRPDVTCDNCNTVKQTRCRATLDTITSELTIFLAGHTAYEEKMMELLPDTPSCQAHIKAHKLSHQGIAKQLKKLAVQGGNETPRVVSKQIWRVVGNWLGDHSTIFDSHLIHLGKSDQTTVDLDEELVTMLDRHVFPDRPTRSKASSSNAAALKERKREVRRWFESLSPAQRNVFWHVIEGSSNREIAEKLGVSVNTIKSHRSAIFQKMAVNSVLELVKKAELLR